MNFLKLLPYSKGSRDEKHELLFALIAADVAPKKRGILGFWNRWWKSWDLRRLLQQVRSSMAGFIILTPNFLLLLIAFDRWFMKVISFVFVSIHNKRLKKCLSPSKPFGLFSCSVTILSFSDWLFVLLQASSDIELLSQEDCVHIVLGAPSAPAVVWWVPANSEIKIKKTLTWKFCCWFPKCSWSVRHVCVTFRCRRKAERQSVQLRRRGRHPAARPSEAERRGVGHRQAHQRHQQHPGGVCVCGVCVSSGWQN